jgi:NAD(P)-dependent dehydrogenase (short-subunit alcohol dehydrogenase family)
MAGLKGRKALVTGASSGMGRAIAAHLSADGAQVLAVGRNGEKLAEAASGNSGIIPFVQDLAEEGAAEFILAQVGPVLGGLDILVNCAGAFELAPVTEVTEAHLNRLMIVNFIAPAMLCVGAVDTLRHSQAGRIINIGSLATHYTDRGMAGYNASKQALVGFTMNLALELGPLGITANLISPGMTRTGMTEELLADPEIHSFFAGRSPVGRIGTCEDIAHAVAYFASDGAGYANGTVIRLDGGYAIGAHSSDWSG